MTVNLFEEFPHASEFRKKTLNGIFQTVLNSMEEASIYGKRSVKIIAEGKGKMLCEILVDNTEYIEEKLGYEIGLDYPSDKMEYDGVWNDLIKSVTLSW